MRILLVTSMYPPYGGGGVSSHVETLATQLISRGHAVTVLSCRRGKGRHPQEADLGVPLVQRVFTADYRSMFTRIGRLVRGAGFDVLHFHAFNALALAPLTRDPSSATVFTLHSDSANYLASVRGWHSSHPAYRAVRGFERLASRLPDLTIAVSARMEAYARSIGFEGVVRIPNAVDTDYWMPGPIEVNGGNLIVVPRMHVPKNGIEYAIEAMATILQDAEATLVITGDGPLRGRLEREARSVSAERIRFLGLVDRERLRDLYREAAIVVIPSVTSSDTQENTSIAALEAMACGTPVIASDIGGLPEVVPHAQGGFLVPERDAGAIAEAALRLLADRPLASQLSAGARRHVLDGFSASTWADSVIRAYGEAQRRVGRRRRGR